MKKDRLHQIWDIGSLLALITTVAAIIWQHGHESAWKTNFTEQVNIRLDFLQKEVIEVKESQNKILEVLIMRNK